MSDDDAWANFVASINPVELETERMRVHADLDHERPGSRWDHEMRAAHAWLKNERLKPRPGPLETRVMQVEDADAFTAEHGGMVLVPRRPLPDVTDEELDQRFAAYAAARKKAA